MILSYIVYASIGRLIIFILQRFPLHDILDGMGFSEGKFLRGLLSCDLCLGVWVYTILAYIMQIDLLEGWFGYYPVINEIITGIFTSFMVYLIRIGWQTEFTETVIKME